MSEMVERVARTLARSSGFSDPDMLDHRTVFGSDPPVIDTRPIWFRFQREARAAIDAMRSPTEAMLAAVDSDEHPFWEIVAMWRAMIDEALK